MNRRIPEKDQRKLIDERPRAGFRHLGMRGDHDRNNNITGEFADYIPGLLNWVLEMDGDEATQIIKDPLNHAPGLLKSKLENLIDTNSIAAWLNEKVTYIDGYETQIGCKSPLGESKENIWLYANYCQYCSLTGVNAISSARFSYLLLDLCNNQLGFTVRKGRDRKGAFIQGLKIRDHLDVDLPPLIEGIYTQSCDELVLTVTSRQSPVTSNGQLTVTHDQSKVSNVCETARGVNERTKLVTGDWSLVTEDVTGSVTGERRTSDGRDGCDDFSETSNKNQSSSVGLLEKVIVSSETKSEREKNQKNPSQSSHSTSVRVTEDSQPVTTHPLTPSREGELKGVGERGDLMKQIDLEMAQLGWSTNTGKEYLLSKYGVSSRKRLSDSQLLEFYKDLKAASSQPIGQTPNYEVGQLLQGLIPHPMGMIKVKGKVVEVNGDLWLEDKHGVTYPLTVMDSIKVLSRAESNG
ncbi:MAG: hypothetical protein QNJ37_12030 [Crocosphaera sp.]|nr:hypothetical protein [Crocosphaera sp.]